MDLQDEILLAFLTSQMKIEASKKSGLKMMDEPIDARWLKIMALCQIDLAISEIKRQIHEIKAKYSHEKSE